MGALSADAALFAPLKEPGNVARRLVLKDGSNPRIVIAHLKRGGGHHVYGVVLYTGALG